MSNYEIVMVLDAVLDDSTREAEVEKLKTAIQSAGELKEVEARGKRKLAYNINKKDHGDYYVVTFQAEPSKIEDITEVFKNNQNVLRHITVKN